VTDVRNQLRVEPLTSSGTPVGDDVLARRVARQVAAALPGAKTGEDWWLTGWRVEGPDKHLELRDRGRGRPRVPGG
jgi:hypothetical protein